VIGEAPGAEEDKQKRFFVGQSGQMLRRVFDENGIHLEDDCWIYNSLICRPPNNATPTEDQVTHCRPNVVKVIQENNPEKILLLGSPAVRSVLGWIWKPAPGGIQQWAGYTIPSRRLNSWICPTYHPAFVGRTQDRDNDAYNPAAEVWWRRHLDAAFQLQGRPYPGEIRDFDKEVLILWTTEDVQKYCRLIIEDGLPIAVDYETNGLKPDADCMKLWSVAFSNGKRTISFLYSSAVKDAIASVLFCDLPKIAANLKFEQRWTLKYWGRPIKNLRFDTIIGSHIMNNRQGTKSVKFNAMALLGYSGDEKQHRYDEVVSAYFDSAGGNEPNDIASLDMTQLLHYGGIDAILEFELAKYQRPHFK